MLSVTPKGPRKTNLGRALLHLFGWYAAVVFAFVALAYALPNTGDPDCQDTSCSSLRKVCSSRGSSMVARRSWWRCSSAC